MKKSYLDIQENHTWWRKKNEKFQDWTRFIKINFIFYLITLISSRFQLLFIPFNGEIAPCIVPPKKSLVNSFISIVLPSINKLTSNEITSEIYSSIELKFFFYKNHKTYVAFIVWIGYFIRKLKISFVS